MSVAKLAALELSEVSDDQTLTKPFKQLQPLPPFHPKVPSMPADLVPSPLRSWIVDISERMQVPLEFVAIPAITAIASVVGRKLAIRPKAEDDWQVVPNLWGAIVARPGKMKSPTLAESLKPLRELASKARLLHEESMDAAGAHLESLKAREKAIKDQLRKVHAKANGDPADLEKQLTEVRREIRQQGQVMNERRFVVNDSTVEKLGELLIQNPTGLLLERDELTGWLRSLDREDRRGDREFFLEGWNGSNAYTYDRIGRGTLHVPALCISIIGGIQPSKLSKYVSEALSGGYAADGLLQRFQLLVWPEEPKEWKFVDRQPNLTARKSVFCLFCRLADLPPVDTGTGTPTLRFTARGQELFNAWYSNLEHRLRSDEMSNTPAFESHLAKYKSLMPSLALLFHLTESSERKPVSLSAAQNAANWCDFLELHARKLLAPEINFGQSIAIKLAEKIKQGAILSDMTVREIYNAGWTGLKKADDVLAGIQALEELGWAQSVTRKPTKKGGRPSLIVVVNPLAIGESR